LQRLKLLCRKGMMRTSAVSKVADVRLGSDAPVS
jgi:hypothetical protein